MSYHVNKYQDFFYSHAELGSLVPKQFRRNFQQVEQTNWYYQSSADDKIYESSVEHIAQQMKEQKKQSLKRKIKQLGLAEGVDYDGKAVLKNNIPIQKTLSGREFGRLMVRLAPQRRKQAHS